VRLARALLVLLLFAVALSQPVHSSAAPPSKRQPDEALSHVWKSAPVHFPVATDAVDALPPFVRDVPVVRGKIKVEPGRSATLWIDALNTVRVRTHDPDARSRPRFFRVARRPATESGWSRVLIEEPGVKVDDGSWYLRQLPGKGAAWIISADEALELHIEVATPRSGRLVWEYVEDEVVRWIRRDTKEPEANLAPPTIPGVEGSTRVQNRLASDAFLARRTLALDPGSSDLSRAMEDWRIARAIEGISAIRPLVRPYFATKNLNAEFFGKHEEVTLTPDPNELGWMRLPDEGAWSFEAHGPGVLRVDMRAIYPEKDAELPSEIVEGDEAVRVDTMQYVEIVRDDQHRLASSRDPGTPTMVRSPGSDEVFPLRENLRLETGERVGHRRTIRIRLAPGKNRYHLRHIRGEFLVRVNQARRLQRLARSLRGESVPGALRRLDRVVGRYPGPAVEILRALYATLAPLRRGEDAYVGLTPIEDPLLALTLDVLKLQRLARNTEATPPITEQDVRELALRLDGIRREAPEDFQWWLRHSLADALHESHLDELSGLALGDPGASASAFALATVAAYTIGPDGALPAWSIAGLRAAQREAPLNEEVRDLFNETWGERTRWAKLTPELHRAIEPWSWVDLAPDPRRPEHAYEAGVLWRIEPGSEVPFLAPEADFDPERAAIVRAHVAAAPGIVSVTLDGHRFNSLSSSTLESFELAATPGEHTISVDGPAGTHAYLELAPTDAELTARARRTRMWPATVADHPLSYKLDASPTPGVLRIDLRVVYNPERDPVDPRREIHLEIVPDVGPPIPLTLRPGDPIGADAAGHPMGGLALSAPGPAGPRLSLRIPTPPMAQRIEVVPEAGAPQLAVSISVRRHDTEDPPPIGANDRQVFANAAEPALLAVRRLSERIVMVEWDVPARIERGYRLLDLGQIVYARQDLYWLLHADSDKTNHYHADIWALKERIDSWTTPTHLATSGSQFEEPAVLSPPLAALVRDDDDRLRGFTGLAKASRDEGPQAGLIGLLEHKSRDAAVLLALNARWLAKLEEWPEAAIIWAKLLQEHRVWQAGLAAARAYVHEMDRPEEERRFTDAGIAHGLVELMRPHVQNSTLRRLAAVTAKLSESRAVSDAELTSGYERLKAPREPLTLTPNERTRRALLVPPWPHRGATILRPGTGTALGATLNFRTKIAADIWCQVMREDRPTKTEDSRIIWSADGGEKFVLRIPPKQSHSYATAVLDEGKHKLELRLDERSSAQMCSVRFRYLEPGASPRATYERALSEPPVKSQVRRRWWAISKRHPTELTVQGGVSLWLEARADLVDPAEKVRIIATPTKGGKKLELTLPLDPQQDTLVTPGERMRLVRAGKRASGVLLLLESEPYRVRIVSPKGALLARLRVRHERAGTAPPPPQANQIGVLAADGRDTAPFSTGEFGAAAPLIAATDYSANRSRFGTVSSEIEVGSDDLADADDFRPRSFLSVRSQYRRVLYDPHLWVAVGPELRMRQNTETGGGGRLSFVAAKIPGGFRAQIGASTLAQRSGWGARLSGRVDRPFRLTGRTRLIPGLYAALRHQSIEGEETALVNGLRVKDARLLHPGVYTQYVNDHPIALRPDLRLRWNPFQDQLATLSANLVPNSDFGSLDQVNLGAGWQGLIDLRTRFLPEYKLDYQASYRLDDAHRSSAFWRHRIRVGLEWAAYGNDIGRLIFGVADSIYASGPFGARNIFSALVRYDLLLGRGLRDFSPQAMTFRTFHERRLWEDSP
jgi:hypothetical protein